MRKTFVLDTNVLLHNPESIMMFSDNVVVLPMTVIEELDGFKTHSDELGRNARQVIRALDKLRLQGSLRTGVNLENGGLIKIVVGRELHEHHTGLEKKYADNRILTVAYHLHCELHDKGGKVIFVSKDINCRIKASALGVEVQDFESQKINSDLLYTGLRTIEQSPKFINDLFQHKTAQLDVDLFPNEFVLLQDTANEKHTALARADEKNKIVLLSSSESCSGIKPRNREQHCALDLLLNEKIQIVTLVGGAGTGKTLLALAAALDLLFNKNKFNKILVTRPIIPLGKDLGFLPGSKDNKMALWMQPIFDNLAYLFSAANSTDTASAKRKIDKLLSDGDLELEALTYIRGRSIPQQYIIIDEAQNLTPHEVKTIISRAGEGSKMVLTGDPEQIDNPYLDAESNGLSYAVERLKNSALHGHITLRKSERSNLAGTAAALL